MSKLIRSFLGFVVVFFTLINGLSVVHADVDGLSGNSNVVIVDVAAGHIHTVALDSTGQLWSWGDNSFGQLGDGTLENRNFPMPISGMDNIIAVSTT